MSDKKLDSFFMRRALHLAVHGAGRVHPNPLVGAVLVKKNKVIGEGAHEHFGGPHAEVNAILDSKEDTAGSTLYVTLEPCAHHGKTPPCADLLIKKNIKRVVTGAKDPNPIVAGRGLRRLRKAGVRVSTGVLEGEAAALNRDYGYWMRRKMPYVVVKIAQSLDGRTATRPGEARWITDRTARKVGHGLRALSDAVIVGVNTILKDDPLLTVRYGYPKSAPIRIILDSRLRMPFDARVLSDPKKGKVILAVTKKAPAKRRKLFQTKAEVLVVKEKKGRVDLKSLLARLARRGFVRVLIEGGAGLIESAFAARLVNEFYFFIAPKIIGGKQGAGHALLLNTIPARDFEVKKVGRDYLIRGTF